MLPGKFRETLLLALKVISHLLFALFELHEGLLRSLQLALVVKPSAFLGRFSDLSFAFLYASIQVFLVVVEFEVILEQLLFLKSTHLLSCPQRFLSEHRSLFGLLLLFAIMALKAVIEPFLHLFVCHSSGPLQMGGPVCNCIKALLSYLSVVSDKFRALFLISRLLVPLAVKLHPLLFLPVSDVLFNRVVFARLVRVSYALMNTLNLLVPGRIHFIAVFPLLLEQLIPFLKLARFLILVPFQPLLPFLLQMILSLPEQHHMSESG